MPGSPAQLVFTGLEGPGPDGIWPCSFPSLYLPQPLLCLECCEGQAGAGVGGVRGGGEGLDESNEYCLMLTDYILISLLQLYQQYHLSVEKQLFCTFFPSLVDAEHLALNIPLCILPTLPTLIHTEVYFALHHAMSQWWMGMWPGPSGPSPLGQIVFHWHDQTP